MPQTTVSGEVRSLQQRSERMGEGAERLVWSFRIERYDNQGNRLPPVPVEMRGFSIEGQVSEGDVIEVTGKLHDGTLQATSLTNKTTGAAVRARSYKVAIVVTVVVFLVIVAAMVGFFVVTINRNDARFTQQQQDADEAFCQQATQVLGSPPPGC